MGQVPPAFLAKDEIVKISHFVGLIVLKLLNHAILVGKQP